VKKSDRNWTKDIPKRFANTKKQNSSYRAAYKDGPEI